MSRILEKLSNLLLEKVPDLKAVYLYGSFGTELEREESDIDLAFLAAAPLDPMVAVSLKVDLTEAAGREVDLADLLSASTVFRAQVLSSGKCILCMDESARAFFEMTTLSMYAALNEERREILKDIEKRGHVHAR